MGKKPKKKIHARENAKKKNSRKEEGKEKKIMQKEGPIVTFIYSAFHKTFDRRFAKFVVNKFHKFASNLGISIRNCQSKGKL